MYSQSDKSFAFDLCMRCQAAIHEHDRFCRHCGAELNEYTELLAIADLLNRKTANDLRKESSLYTTVPFGQLDSRRPVSSPLARRITTELAANGNRFARRTTMVLITVPIWLMMILLSPFDAYAAAKLIAKRM
ncbi:MAG: zinc ribbon domain-containing protein [Acidobacteria bacterium]|nr:zinc ribbon domain-containing protein [Acidobacteriota bacterium]